MAAIGAVAFLLFGYAKRNPNSKIASVIGPKVKYTNEFDESGSHNDLASSTIVARIIPMYAKYPVLGRLKEWYEWESQRIIFIALFFVCNIGVAIYGITSNLGNPLPYLPWAKGFGKMLDFNLGFVLLPVLRNFMSFLRTTPANLILPLDHNLKLHRLAAYMIGICAIGHIACHYADFIYQRDVLAMQLLYTAFLNLSGFTGHIISALMLIMFSTALIKRRIFNLFGKRYDGYTVFMFVHRLWVPCYALLWLHSQNFWPFSLWPLAFMFVEKYIQNRRTRLDVVCVGANMVGKDVLALRMKLVGKRRRLRYRAGQYIFLNVPDIAEEFHPFTLTSAPEAPGGVFSCHIRCRPDMDWTYRLRQRLGFAESVNESGIIPAINKPITEENSASRAPRLRIDGPYGSASEEVFDYDTVILVGAGIGVTPFISILKSISIRMKAKSSDEINSMSISFFWVCRDQQEFNSFQDVFDELLNDSSLNNRLEINSYTTGEINLKSIKHERYNQFAGKPNWSRIFKEKATKHNGEEIGVFLCGPNAMAVELAAACKTNTTKSPNVRAEAELTLPVSERTVFKFHKENF